VRNLPILKQCLVTGVNSTGRSLFFGFLNALPSIFEIRKCLEVMSCKGNIDLIDLIDQRDGGFPAPVKVRIPLARIACKTSKSISGGNSSITEQIPFEVSRHPYIVDVLGETCILSISFLPSNAVKLNLWIGVAGRR